MSAPTSVTLNLAADLIEERGWTRGSQGMLPYPSAPKCLEGAISAASGLPLYEGLYGDTHTYPSVHGVSCPAYDAVVAHLDLPGQAWLWNDAPGRTATEVVEVLRACSLIEAARERSDQRVSAVSA